jgi:pyruvate dehydrogenase complex dehydrogenase (E1) component
MNTADKKFKEVTDHQIALQQEANSRREAVRAVSVAMQNSNLPTALRDALKALADEGKLEAAKVAAAIAAYGIDPEKPSPVLS